jgi:hypothetical protein
MRIALCLPIYDNAKAQFVSSLTRMIAHTLSVELRVNDKPIKPQIEMFIRSTSFLPFNRQMLIQDAMNWGADFMFCVDSDHTFPPDTLLRLIGHDRPVVGANCVVRNGEMPTAVLFDGGYIWSTPERAAEPPQRVDRLGLGMVLLHRRAIEQVAAHLNCTSDRLAPMFQMELKRRDDGSLDAFGEDAFFFDLLAAAGVEVYADHELSREVTHISQALHTFGD